MIRTIFFDFGNVVAFFDHRLAIAKLARFTELPGEELLRLFYNGPLEDQYERGNLGTSEYVSEALKLGRLKCDEATFLAAFADIFRPNAEVIELIPQLSKRYRLILASNTNDAHFQKFTEQFAGVFEHFATLCPSHHARHRKPEPGYFEYCQRFAEAERGECLFLDDLQTNIDGAIAHGWQGLQYRSGANLARQLSEMGIQFEPPNP